MARREKPSASNSILRIVFVGLSVLFQAGWLLLLIFKLNNYSIYINIATTVLALVVVLRLYSRHSSSAMKMPWIMLILAFPVMGLSLYLMIEIFGDLGKAGKRLRSVQKTTRAALPENQPLLDKLRSEDISAANISRYLLRYAGAPIYENTGTRYFSEAADAFEAMKQDLRKAQKYIFMEYFIIEEGYMWGKILDILIAKAAAGVDVRVMYDGMCEISNLPSNYRKLLEAEGIRAKSFARIVMTS